MIKDSELSSPKTEEY